jgi:transposase
LTITCGIDWAENHHDVALVDEAGKLVAKRRIGDDVQGYRQLLELLADAGESAGEPVPVAVETARGLLISCLRTTGRKVYSINPMAVARYRERHTVTRAKSDHADAMVLANILRTDAAAHRPLPADSELARVIAVLARAQQDAAWNRGQLSNQLRSHLKQYFPAALAAFQVKGVGLGSREARAVLAVASDPGAAAKLTEARLGSVLRKAGRQRGTRRGPGACAPSSLVITCISFQRSSRRWAVRPSRWCSSSTRRAVPLTTSPRPPQRRSPGTLTPRSCPASPGSGRSPAPGCSERSAMTAPGSATHER